MVWVSDNGVVKNFSVEISVLDLGFFYFLFGSAWLFCPMEGVRTCSTTMTNALLQSAGRKGRIEDGFSDKLLLQCLLTVKEISFQNTFIRYPLSHQSN